MGRHRWHGLLVLLIPLLWACEGSSDATTDTGPTDPGVQDIPGVLDPGVQDLQTSDPGQIEDNGLKDPGTTDQGSPEDSGTQDPGTTDPGQPEDSGTQDPGTTDPGQPEDSGTQDPGTTDPGQPEDSGTQDPGTTDPGQPLTPEQTFPTSLHATVVGMQTVYEDGFEKWTGVPYTTPNLGCADCHAPSVQPLPRRCESCHLQPGEPVADSTCLACHSRQKIMIQTIGQYPDVHLQAGMHCRDCHSSKEMHGDGTPYTSMWDEGAMDTRCENCHVQAPNTDAHTVHGDKLDCTACHVKSVVNCFSCHFDSQVNEGKKIHSGALHGWTFLVNRNGKVRAGNFMSLTYQNANRYVRWAPFHDHTVTAEGRQCSECHNNAAVQQYKQDGFIRLTWWDPDAPEGQPKLQNLKGVIPVVAGKMRFQFMVHDGTAWVPMPEGVVAPDGETFWSCDGLTPAQMTKLGYPIP